jgi:tetratricopeptide (TPR) repeat protein
LPAGLPASRSAARRRVRLFGLLAAGGALALGVVWLVWRRERPPEPPVILLAEADRDIARVIDRARRDVLNKPRSGPAWGHLGKVLLAHALVPEARFCLIQAEKYDPREPRWPYLHARIEETQNPARCVELLERVLELGAEGPEARLWLGEILLQQDQLGRAEGHFREVLEEDARHPRAHLGLGLLAYRRGRWRESLDHLTRSARHAPDVKTTRALLAEVYFRLGDRRAAERERALQARLPSDQVWPDPYMEEVDSLRAGVEAVLGHADDLQRRGRALEAEVLLVRLAEGHPQSSRAWAALGLSRLHQGKWAPAEEALRQALARGPDTFTTRCALGFALKSQGKLRQAAECYRRATVLKPQDALAHYHLAHCRSLLGDERGAIRALREAVRCKPDSADGQRALGSALAQDGQLAEALEHLRYAVQLAPGDEAARKLLAEVRRRTGRPGETEK